MTNEQTREEDVPDNELPPAVVIPEPHPGPTPDRRAYDAARDEQVRKYNEEQEAITEAANKRAAEATKRQMEEQAQQQSQGGAPQQPQDPTRPVNPVHQHPIPEDAPLPDEDEDTEPVPEQEKKRGSKYGRK
jgi:hypothetical protein